MGNNLSTDGVNEQQRAALLRDNYSDLNINKTREGTPTSDTENPEVNPFIHGMNLELLERHSIAQKIKDQQILLHPYAAQVIQRWEEHTETSFSIFGHDK